MSLKSPVTRRSHLSSNAKTLEKSCKSTLITVHIFSSNIVGDTPNVNADCERALFIHDVA